MLLAGKVVEVLHYQPQYELRSISVAVWTTLRTIIILPHDPSHITDYKEVNRVDTTNLKNIPTNQLVEELGDRDGVEKIVIPPYEISKIKAEGPAIVLVVTD